MDIKKINNLDKSEFLSIFGNVFEKSKWISEKVFDQKPFKNLESFVSKLIGIYENCDNKTVLEILNLHPELAVEKKLTANSEEEQNKANLKECTPEEFNEFKKLNNDFKSKFNIPFIYAVRGKTKKEILDEFISRLKSDNIEQELDKSLIQVKKIATLRINEIISDE